MATSLTTWAHSHPSHAAHSHPSHAGSATTSDPPTLSAEDRAKLSLARSQGPETNCARRSIVKEIKLCEYGDLNSSKVLMLIGDSHAGHWVDAIAAAASTARLRLVVRWISSCPAIGVRVVNTSGYAIIGCAGYTADSMTLVKALHPVGVIISQAEAYYGRIRSDQGAKISGATQRTVWRDHYLHLMSQLATLHVRSGVIYDNPRVDYNPNDCLQLHGLDDGSCASSRSAALDEISTLAAISHAVADPRATYRFHTIPVLCSSTRCQVVLNRTPVYQDANHLSRQWTLTQKARLGTFIQHVIV